MSEPTTVEVAVEVASHDADAPPLDADRWAALLATALADEGVVAGAEASLTFVDRSTMAELNVEHMGAEGPTDVLSFPMDGLAAAAPGPDGPAGHVGDVVICAAVAAENAPGHAGSVDDELALLVVHGALHLLDHDHAEPDERTEMQARERALLAAHHGLLARDPWGEG